VVVAVVVLNQERQQLPEHPTQVEVEVVVMDLVLPQEKQAAPVSSS
jgi:hypothetical protein